MKLFIFSLLLVIALGNKFTYNYNDQPHKLFNQFVKHNNILLKSEEIAERYAVFQSNLKIINQLNQEGNGNQFGLTKFSLLSPFEFSKKYLTLNAVRSESDPVAPLYNDSVIEALPDEFDWRPKGAVTPVKDQGSCGSCWAFSATGNMEGQWFLAGHPLTSLSEQNLVDCDHECLDSNDCDQGCNGGLQPNAYNYVIKNKGIDTEESYAYKGEDGTCSFKEASVGTKISNWTMISQDEDQMAAYLVQHGPLAVAVDATIWQFYVGNGVITVPCGTSLDHGVLVVGYGSETDIWGQNIQYWTIKNSWGADWGDSGYIYVQKGNGKCGVNLYVSSAII